MEKNFTLENRTKTVFKDLLGNLAIRFNIIIMKREKSGERKKRTVLEGPAFKSLGIDLLLLTDLLSYRLKTCNKDFHLFSSDRQHGFWNTCKRQIGTAFSFENSSFLFSHQREETICNVHRIHLLNACRISTRHLAASLGQKRQRKSLESLACSHMTGLRVESEHNRAVGSVHACQLTADTAMRFLTGPESGRTALVSAKCKWHGHVTQTCRRATFSKGHRENTVTSKFSISKLYNQGTKTQLASSM